jgi:predicted  nucleic acid-binding Zn-ribbon protein
MADEITQPVEQGSPVQDQAPQGGTDKLDVKLSEEAAKWRVKARELEAQLKQLQPKAEQYDQLQESQKTEAQKLAERIAALEAEVQAKDAAAAKAASEAQLLRLATKAGVDPDVAALLDLSKIDISDEKAALETLSKFARPSANGAQVKPGAVGATGMTDADLRNRYFGASKTTIFGG